METMAFCSSQPAETHWGNLCRNVLSYGTQSSRNRVLIAGSSVARRHEVVRILSGLVLEIVEAGNAKGGRAAISRQQIDLVLIDFDLDNGDATKLCQTLKQASATQFLPVFVTTQ